jgi:antitoxin component of RelBE/YafQ-DinJ toxin-antitoxin module|tara:strand:- start:498 stop:695 length:198 start_codon:yes stop_codon:yes gene_type:complete
MLEIMNAAEIIQEIERLPEEEKGKVVDFMRHLPNEETLAAMEEAKHPEKLEKFDSAADMFKKLGI